MFFFEVFAIINLRALILSNFFFFYKMNQFAYLIKNEINNFIEIF